MLTVSTMQKTMVYEQIRIKFAYAMVLRFNTTYLSTSFTIHPSYGQWHMVTEILSFHHQTGFLFLETSLYIAFQRQPLLISQRLPSVLLTLLLLINIFFEETDHNALVSSATTTTIYDIEEPEPSAMN